jgi:NAD(P)-dependent dehydrogenase (short-subunit alcohol dehydrogenase family)
MHQSLRSKKGKVALVTGAASGLGLAFSLRLAAEGAAVIAVDVANASDLAATLKESGATEADFFQVDVSDEAQVEQLARTVIARHGRCDIIVNNAGIAQRAPLHQITLADWRKVMSVNVESMFLMSRVFVPGMMERNYGRIVNITSDTLGSIATDFCAYIASKGAVVGFTRALANDVGPHGIIVNCIAPGLTRTPRTEEEARHSNLPIFEMIARGQAIKRQAVPEDLVGAMSFLTSDDAAFITGHTLIVDGGSLKAM